MLEMIVTIAIAGFMVFLVLQIPMPQVFKNIILGVVAICAVLYVLQSFGIHSGFRGMGLK